jgi:hypothetical protein
MKVGDKFFPELLVIIYHRTRLTEDCLLDMIYVFQFSPQLLAEILFALVNI